MSDIKVGDKIRATHDYFKASYPGEYEVQQIPNDDNPYVIVQGPYGPGAFLLSEVEKVKPEYQFKVGDRVQVDNTDYDEGIEYGTVQFVDKTDDTLPYRVVLDNDDDDQYGDWYTFAEVSAVVEEPKPERVDHTALIEWADEVLNSYRVLEIGGPVAAVLKNLRDALVEESYREGK